MVKKTVSYLIRDIPVEVWFEFKKTIPRVVNGKRWTINNEFLTYIIKKSIKD